MPTKKWSIFLVFSIILLICFTILGIWLHSRNFVSDHNGENEPNCSGIAEGEVIFVDPEKIVISVDKDCELYQTAAAAEFSTNVISAKGLPQLKKGDTIRVLYNDGKVYVSNETAQLTIVFAVYKIENGVVIPNT